MKVDMNVEEVLAMLMDLKEEGKSLSKKKVKGSHPQLMRSALFYFPSWEHALEKVGA